MGIRRKTKNIKLSIIEVNDYFKELNFMLWELDVKLKILN